MPVMTFAERYRALEARFRHMVVCALGRQVAAFLRPRHFPRDVVELLHYSGQAALARKRALVGREAEHPRRDP